MRARFVAACLVAFAVRADAKGWPSPAAGPTMTGDPELIFTFDDGPNKDLTPLVLDILAKHHIHAVFFLVGEMAAQPTSPAIIERMLSEGHIIANHTMTHQDLCRVKDPERAAHEIDDGKTAIETASHWHVTWFRTPYGVRCDRVDQLLAERGLTHFHWDLDPQEWKHGNKKKAYDYVTKQVAKMTGRNVLLMHDIKKATVEALPEILDFIEAENVRRKETRRRRIRIIQGYELAAEKLPPGTLEWISAVTPSKQGVIDAIASVLP
ncbi:MAG TPA: polysaccharide deacetylase family protein [Kofleriaceae bacterium]|nr:polysaccharide deacetylase family protein [Kofleriaceae bacterium]